MLCKQNKVLWLGNDVCFGYSRHLGNRSFKAVFVTEFGALLIAIVPSMPIALCMVGLAHHARRGAINKLIDMCSVCGKLLEDIILQPSLPLAE